MRALSPIPAPVSLHRPPAPARLALSRTCARGRRASTVMPLLPRQPNLFPPDLFNPEYLAQHVGREWWVLYTLARREKELMRRLFGCGVSFYCPVIVKRTRAPSGRVHVAHVPLFTSYVFLYGDEMAR